MNCALCDEPIPLKRLNGKNASRVKYCSVECGNAASLPKVIREVPLTSGTVGALSEIVVAADLMKLGWHVYRAMSPSAPCDLIAVGDGVSHRIEVRTALIGGPGKIQAPFKDSDIGRSDCLALVIQNSDVVYVPDLFRGEGWNTLDRLTEGLAYRLRLLRDRQEALLI